MKLKNALIKSFLQMVLGVSAGLATKQAFEGASLGLMRGLAKVTIRTKKIKKTATLQDLAVAWQRGFPSNKQVPIRDISEDTVYAEIHTPCPLRGTGNVAACYRMMEYDRQIAKRAGGQFIVLSSQAQIGHTFCRVALRKEGMAMDDLVPVYDPTMI